MPSSQYKMGARTILADIIFFQLPHFFPAEFKMIDLVTQIPYYLHYTPLGPESGSWSQ